MAARAGLRQRVSVCFDQARGPESAEVLNWLARPWFHPLCGNHELMTWRDRERPAATGRACGAVLADSG